MDAGFFYPPDPDFRTASHGYIGTAIIGDNNSGTCDGEFSWAPSVTSSTAPGFVRFEWSYGGAEVSLGGKTCDYSIYIPSSYAGGLAKYFVYAINIDGGYTYLFNHTVDQEATTGWVDLGTYTVPSDYNTTMVVLDNLEPTRPGWDVAFDAAGFQCA